MKKENMDDLIMYQDRSVDSLSTEEKPVSDELEKAIQSLIYRLKELGPIESA